MKINLAKHAGFCIGVKRALDIALKTAQSSQNVVMLGDIVHNENVVNQIKEAGLKKIERLTRGNDKTLLIRAHGTSLKTLKKAHTLGYLIVDATCPMVKEIHKIAQSVEQKGYKVIVIGDKKHDEVQGIIGQLKHKAVVIDIYSPLPIKTIQRIKKGALVVQSTQNREKVLKLVGKLKKTIPDLIFFDTICNPTRMKQEEIQKMPLKNDVMIVIGSKASANTKRLYEIAKALNKQSYWIQSKNDIRPTWFRKTKSVGITAGASTPESTIKEIIKYLRLLTANKKN